MIEYKISYIGDNSIGNIHHIGVDYNGNYYGVIFGKYVNGGFFSIPSEGVGGELSYDFGDVLWNMESLSKVLKNKNVANAIALAIEEFSYIQKNTEEI